MHVYVCMSMCACLCVHVCACMSVRACLCVHVCACMSVRACLCVHVCVCMSVRACLCVHVCVCMSVDTRCSCANVSWLLQLFLFWSFLRQLTSFLQNKTKRKKMQIIPMN